MQRKRFLLIFLLGIAGFVAANVFDYSRTSPPCCDFSAPFGVPVPLGRWGGFFGTLTIYWRGLLADIFIAVIVSLFLAYVVERLLHRRVSQRADEYRG